MTNVNLPILYQNVMMGLPTELGQQAFLWATERPQNDRMCYWAENFAHQVERICDDIIPMLTMAKRVHEEQRGVTISDQVIDDLMDFILIRHANWCCKGNVRPDYVNKSTSALDISS